MSIAEKLSEVPANRVICRTCNWINSQSETDQAAIKQAAENPAWSVEALVRVLKEDGLPTSASAFRHHIAQGH